MFEKNILLLITCVATALQSQMAKPTKTNKKTFMTNLSNMAMTVQQRYSSHSKNGNSMSPIFPKLRIVVRIFSA